MHIQWDYYIGKQAKFTDANSVDTKYSYSGDPFDRLVLAKRAAAKAGFETHATFLYPNLTTVTTEQDQASIDDQAIVSTVYYDGLGRQKESRRLLAAASTSA